MASAVSEAKRPTVTLVTMIRQGRFTLKRRFDDDEFSRTGCCALFQGNEDRLLFVASLD